MIFKSATSAIGACGRLTVLPALVLLTIVLIPGGAFAQSWNSGLANTYIYRQPPEKDPCSIFANTRWQVQYIVAPRRIDCNPANRKSAQVGALNFKLLREHGALRPTDSVKYRLRKVPKYTLNKLAPISNSEDGTVSGHEGVNVAEADHAAWKGKIAAAAEKLRVRQGKGSELSTRLADKSPAAPSSQTPKN